MPLPTSVSPGDLITAKLLNAILEALHDLQTAAALVSGFDQRIRAIEVRLDRIDKQAKDLKRDSTTVKGAVDQLKGDRATLFAQFDDLSKHVVPDIHKLVEQVNQDLIGRIEPIVRDVDGLKFQVVKPGDPVERIPGLKQTDVDFLRNKGITSVEGILAVGFDINSVTDQAMRGRIETAANTLRLTIR